MANKAEIVAGLNQFADTLEKIATTYDAITALPGVPSPDPYASRLLAQATNGLTARLAEQAERMRALLPRPEAQPTTWSLDDVASEA